MAALIPSGDWWRLHAPGPVEDRELTCPVGHCWWADGHVEYGLWLPERDDDLYCPECGIEAE